jgi:hypothetical protein
VISASGERAGGTSAAGAIAEQIDAGNAISKFAALGTYLANLRDDAIRARYTQLTREIEKAIGEAGRIPPGGLGKLFEPADLIFAELNDDCVKSAKE